MGLWRNFSFSKLCSEPTEGSVGGGQGNGWWERGLGCFEALGVLVTSGAASNYPG